MKKIILDHFRRWSLALFSMGLVVFVLEGLYARISDLETPVGQTFGPAFQTMVQVFLSQIIIFLGLLLPFDLMRGLARVLTTMPVTARQTGRALWLASVALPSIALSAAGLLALLVFYAGTDKVIPWKSHLTFWTIAVLSLGAVFGMFSLTAAKIPETFSDKARALCSVILVMLSLFSPILFSIRSPTGILSLLVIAVLAFLSVTGWFRAERLILNHAGFHAASQRVRRSPTRDRITQGFGGMRFLVRTIVVRMTFMSLGMAGAMASTGIFISRNLNHDQAIVALINGGSTPLMFLCLFDMISIISQMRLLRTLPITPSVLSATLVFLPVLFIATLSVIILALANSMADGLAFRPVIKIFLLVATITAVGIPLIVSRGLDVWTYLVIFLGSIISPSLTLIFHVRETPLWISLALSGVLIALSFALTTRLILKSSTAYRVRPSILNHWGGMFWR